jgi:hypothetical protein
MRKLILLIPLLALSACATASGKTDTPAMTAGKSLVATQQMIVAARTAIVEPCRQGVIPQDACEQMDALYNQAKPLYDAAVDAEIAVLRGEQATTQGNPQGAFLEAAEGLLTLAAKYGVKP